MIELRAEPYCEDCPDFEATSYTYTDSKVVNGSLIKTIIHCKNHSKCLAIEDHIKRSLTNA